LQEPHNVGRFAHQIGSTNLWVLSASSLRGSRPAPQSRDQMAALVRQLRDQFDYVLVDAPPVTHYHEAVIFGQMSDGVVLVVEANATRREIARQTKERLEAADVRLLGTVLNNRTYPIPQEIYAHL
jgi:Mrp family chromosome partitioning ATPase